MDQTKQGTVEGDIEGYVILISMDAVVYSPNMSIKAYNKDEYMILMNHFLYRSRFRCDDYRASNVFYVDLMFDMCINCDC